MSGGIRPGKCNVSTPTERQSPSERILAAGLQRLDIKLYLTVQTGLTPDEVWTRLIAVFGRWRHDEGEELVDLQDYAHVTNGPGIVLVSKRWVLSIDWSDGEPGVLLSTRRDLEGALSERFVRATRVLLEKAGRLLAEEELRDIVKPRCGELSIAVNDRVLYPDPGEADAELRPEVEKLLAKLYGPASYELERASESGSRLKYRARAQGADALTLAELTARLEG